MNLSSATVELEETRTNSLNAIFTGNPGTGTCNILTLLKNPARCWITVKRSSSFLRFIPSLGKTSIAKLWAGVIFELQVRARWLKLCIWYIYWLFVRRCGRHQPRLPPTWRECSARRCCAKLQLSTLTRCAITRHIFIKIKAVVLYFLMTINRRLRIKLWAFTWDLCNALPAMLSNRGW